MEEYANEFQHLWSHITRFPIFTSDQVQMCYACVKDDVENKVTVDPKGDGGPWEDIKHLIHYVVTIDNTYAQTTKTERGHQASICKWGIIISTSHHASGMEHGYIYKSHGLVQITWWS